MEDGIALEVEPLSGQKTGMFIDQRETRARVGALAKGARVLDLYAYAGGFSLAAARGGAAAVTAVDSSARAVARTLAHAAKNGVAIEAVEADAFRYLETATPRAFDLLVVDPPKFARARKDLEAARKGYERLNALALQAAAPGAILVTCSCSQNVDAETLRAHRRRRRQAGRPRGPHLRTPRPRRRPPAAARLHRGPVPQSPPLLRGLADQRSRRAGARTRVPRLDRREGGRLRRPTSSRGARDLQGPDYGAPWTAVGDPCRTAR